MINDEAIAVLICTALSISWFRPTPIIPLISPNWVAFFGFVIFRKEIWSTVEDLTARVPLPTKIIFIAILCYFLVPRGKPDVEIRADEKANKILDQPDQSPCGTELKPLLFPAKTTHTRLFPKKHSFTYSYLLVGIPVEWRGAVGSFFSANLPSGGLSPKSLVNRPWFSIGAGDYLGRGDENLGLRGKLRSYLKSQGEEIKDYPYAYLVTAPRFLGYSFNPVSFWYLYNEQKELQAMILEVNNTFDERRMYFLKGIDSNDPEESWTMVEASGNRFKDVWAKDFHVSPFNSRKGSYALSAQDPFSPHFTGNGMVDNTITLSSSKAHTKLIARICSTQPSVDPTTLGYWARIRFIASWWWVGFATFPRIVKEAAKLFFRRKLHVWYRPEISKDSVGRHATNDEVIIERTFKSFLRSLVESSNLEQSITYRSPIPSSPSAEILTTKSTCSRETSQSETIEFKVITPLFYALLARYSHISEFLSDEILKDDDKTRTFYVSDLKSLLQLFENPGTTETSDVSIPSVKGFSILARLSWGLLHWLRNHARASVQRSPQPNRVDIRHRAFSQLDRFVMRHETPEQATLYRRVVQKLLLSDIIAFGHPEILDAVSYILMVVFSYMFADGVRIVREWILTAMGRGARHCWQAGDEAWCQWEIRER